MYSSFKLAKKYLYYYFTSSNGNGHGVHSPFVFDFITKVLRDKKKYDCYDKIEELRKKLINSTDVIEVEDFGAGSSVIKTDQRAVDAIARSSLKPKKFAQLLYRMVRHYQPQVMIELGTSFGITSAYLACGNVRAHLYTCEGSKAIAGIAKDNFSALAMENIKIIEGDFDKTLTPFLSGLKKIDFAFIDGNHRKEPVMRYFNLLLQKSNSKTIFVFDDIHWSDDMENAWKAIQSHPAVTLTIDLFFIGIVCINTDFKVKQHFSVSF